MSSFQLHYKGNMKDFSNCPYLDKWRELCLGGGTAPSPRDTKVGVFPPSPQNYAPVRSYDFVLKSIEEKTYSIIRKNFDLYIGIKVIYKIMH